MANKSLFSGRNSKLPRAAARNEAGGRAYRLVPKHALAQLAATGCFNGAFYTTAEMQLDELLGLIAQVDDNRFLAKLALYAREKAFMKDMPAALLLALAKRDTKLMHQIFDRVVDNGRVLRTLFQMIRSGQFGRTSLSASLQRAFQRWLNEASESKLLSASIGANPSLRDVLRLARPTPKDNARRALFGWLTDKEVEKWAPATEADLPQLVQRLIAYRKANSGEAQAEIARGLNVRWDLLADAAINRQVWTEIARQMGPQALRMNLNTLRRHDVLRDPEMIRFVADRLGDAEEVRRGRQFPYQYLAAYLNADPEMPHEVRAALKQAAEIACGNIPQLPGPIVIGLDTSGSMTWSVTGNRGHGATSKMRCVDVAALFAAAILRRNPDSVVIPFDTKAYDARLDPDDSILSLSERLAKYGGGGTDCSLPLRAANEKYGKRKFAGCVLVSDNESWVGRGRHGSTGVMTAWNEFVANQQKLGVSAPKLVCIDIQPYQTTQAPEREDILNVGGFSDAVFNVVAAFLRDDQTRLVREVEAIAL
ncbi:TROVE domain-containing protein [Blastopirellula sp. JC732]|uniref:TROVE domain-containing protein n=1 Tax=Blastopirellula sediminis TaxID=2894196 RepID=A0A9X1MJ44_9BACT|nr:TROVE domain-containing protein [Blastopirellula sediminis]MCC9607950.1 TROVE domain-containing protein [Blastopirellula sediminis]MCC9627257.1 TROVE domain-containing protein [Blastopirellula sediminis]